MKGKQRPVSVSNAYARAYPSHGPGSGGSAQIVSTTPAVPALPPRPPLNVPPRPPDALPPMAGAAPMPTVPPKPPVLVVPPLPPTVIVPPNPPVSPADPSVPSPFEPSPETLRPAHAKATSAITLPTVTRTMKQRIRASSSHARNAVVTPTNGPNRPSASHLRGRSARRRRR